MLKVSSSWNNWKLKHWFLRAISERRLKITRPGTIQKVITFACGGIAPVTQRKDPTSPPTKWMKE